MFYDVKTLLLQLCYNYITVIMLKYWIIIFFKKFKIIKTVIIKFRLTMKDQ